MNRRPRTRPITFLQAPPAVHLPTRIYILPTRTDVCIYALLLRSSVSITNKPWHQRQPPPNIGEQLLRLLETKEGADVIFQVGRREFAAHALVLSARSPVLRATLSERKKNTGTLCVVVRVDGVAEAAFEALLHFAYADALPGSGGVRARMEAAGELIAAAERFGMERMRLLCEAVADAETAAATLVLADRLRCQQLKAFCVDYIAEPAKIQGMMGTDAYMSLKESCPLVLVEIMEKVVAALVARNGSSSPAPSKRPEATEYNSPPRFFFLTEPNG